MPLTDKGINEMDELDCLRALVLRGSSIAPLTGKKINELNELDCLRILTLQTSGPSFDPNAQVFFAAAAITDGTQKSAVNQLVLDLKAASIWTKMLALYPFVGGAATPHSFNLKNPATYQITWSGTVTHNANGITGNGSTGWGTTGLNYANDTTANSVAFGGYRRDDATDGGRIIAGGLTTMGYINTRFSDGNSYSACNEGSTDPARAVPASTGLFAMSRVAADDCRIFRNGAQLGATETTGQGVNGSGAFALLSNPGGVSLHSPANLALAFISDGLTSAEIASFYTATQSFQTALGRQV